MVAPVAAVDDLRPWVDLSRAVGEDLEYHVAPRLFELFDDLGTGEGKFNMCSF